MAAMKPGEETQAVRVLAQSAWARRPPTGAETGPDLKCVRRRRDRPASLYCLNQKQSLWGGGGGVGRRAGPRHPAATLQPSLPLPFPFRSGAAKGSGSDEDDDGDDAVQGRGLGTRRVRFARASLARSVGRG